MKTTELIKAGRLIPNEVNAQTVRDESYFNLTQLCRITRYSNPIAALRSTGEIVRVQRDACGNILSGQLIPNLATR